MPDINEVLEWVEGGQISVWNQLEIHYKTMCCFLVTESVFFLFLFDFHVWQISSVQRLRCYPMLKTAHFSGR